MAGERSENKDHGRKFCFLEKNDDRPAKTKTLIIKRFLSYPLVYWIGFLVFVIVRSYSDGKEKLSQYDFTKGVVVDEILLPSRRFSSNASFAQWQYSDGSDTFLFVDKRPFIRIKDIGSKATVIYLKEKHDEAMVYNFQFWINLPFILIASLIAFFIFAISQFIIHWNDGSWFEYWYRRR